MPPRAVVEADDVLADVTQCLVVVSILALPEAFHNRIVPTVALATHAADDAMTRQQRVILGADVLY